MGFFGLRSTAALAFAQDSSEAEVSNNSSQIVQKLWNYCNVLRDDGLSYGDYVEQLTYLLFLKMSHEQTLAPWKKSSSCLTTCCLKAALVRSSDASSYTNATFTRNCASP